jgi:hypothetical protein
MYAVHIMYITNREYEPWYIEFKKMYGDNSQEIECYKIFRDTGYLPKFCK